MKNNYQEEMCKCGHHTKDHSYNPNSLDSNLECDICDCKNFVPNKLKMENISGKIMGIVCIILSVFLVLGIIWEYSVKEFQTDKVVECNDVDGDVIVGDIICYEKIICSTILKFFNSKECKEFIK